MNLLFIFFLTLIINNISFAQSQDSLRIQKQIDSIFNQHNFDRNDPTNPYYTKVKKAIEDDHTILLDKYGNVTVNKFYKFLSELILDEIIDVIKLMARETLSNKEFRVFNKIDFVVDNSIKTDMPVVALEGNIYFDNSSILDIMVRNQLINSDLNFHEKAYYLSSLNISNEFAPEFAQKIVDSKNSNQYIAAIFSQSYMLFFITMHEFYHIQHDDKNLPILQREINADNYAYDQLRKLSKKIVGNDHISESEIYNAIVLLYGKEYSELVKSNKLCPYPNFAGKKILASDFSVIYIGTATIDIIMERDYLTILPIPSNLEINLKRKSNLFEQIKSTIKCHEDSNNIICCMVNFDLEENENLLNHISETKAIRELKIEKSSFLSLNYSDPATISFQLGYFYWIINDKQKSIEYFLSSNMFDSDSPNRVLCNLLLADIYLTDEKFFNIELAQKHFEIASSLNKTTNNFRQEIFDKYDGYFK